MHKVIQVGIVNFSLIFLKSIIYGQIVGAIVKFNKNKSLAAFNQI